MQFSTTRIAWHISSDINEKVDVSPDPADNFLFAMAQASQVDYLVTGSKEDVLALGRHGKTQIVTMEQLIKILKR